MDGIIEFLNTPLGQIIILVVVALFFGKNPDLVNRILEILKIQKPKSEQKAVLENGEAVNLKISPEMDEDLDNITRADAYIAAENLITYYSEMVPESASCQEGLEAAKKAGQCLFH
jgi:hypothetical protein